MSLRLTPWPWRTSPINYADVYGADGEVVALVPKGETAAGNARLIAAAPDLYEELQHLVTLIQPLEREGDLHIPGLATLNGAREALAKANGGKV